MKNILTIAVLLLTISATAQNNNTKTIFVEYSKYNSSFDNPKIKEYSEKYANLYNEFCTEKISSTEYNRKFKILNRLYNVYFYNITENDKVNLIAEHKLIHADGEAYLKEVSFNRAKTHIKSEFKKQNKALYNRVENAKISFKNKHFEKFANEMQELVFEQCATKMTQEEYNKKSLKIRTKYVKWFKDVSKEDTESLLLLYDTTLIKCTEYTIEQQYSVRK